jgi:hypothetical protein
MNKIVLSAVYSYISVCVLMLAGCSTVSSWLSFLPRDYDPVMGMTYVELSIEVSKLDCTVPDGWEDAIAKAKQLSQYSIFRSDPQAENATSIETNLTSALADVSNTTLCNHYLNIANLRLEILNTAWGNR